MKSPITTAGTKTALCLLLLAGGLVVVTWLAWVSGGDPLGPGNASGVANSAIRPWRPALMIGRWVLWCVIWIQWSWIGDRLFHDEPEDMAAKRHQWALMRSRMMGGIAVVEALILYRNVTGV